MQLKEKNTNKVLLHSCCAICSGHPIQHLREIGYEPVLFFFNPNIYPREEYYKRLEAQKKLANELHCELIIEEGLFDLYPEVMSGYENHPEGSERCYRCIELRLLRTIQKAHELKINYFTSTLSVSPHKSFEKIEQIGKLFSKYYKVNFLDVNFKKQNGFVKTSSIAKELDLYRQNYCGCDVSMQRITDKKEIENGV